MRVDLFFVVCIIVGLLLAVLFFGVAALYGFDLPRIGDIARVVLP